MRELDQIIKGIRQTEKGARVERNDQFVLRVAPDANKQEIKEAAEAMFKVSVEKVNTQRYQGKWRRLTRRGGRRPDWKKAIVTVAKGQKIELK
jgi:large subunit ribosomal protein L23